MSSSEGVSARWSPASSRADWQAHEKAQAVSVMAQVERYRKERGLTVEGLCRALDDQGWPVSVSTMNGMLGKKRSAITVTELFAFARALDVAPLNLLFPFDNRLVEVLPGRLSGSAFDMSEWFIGEAADSPFKALRDHEKLVSIVLSQNADIGAVGRAGFDIKRLNLKALSQAITDLAAIRKGLRATGIALPQIRPALSDFITSGMPLARDNDLPLGMVFPIAGLNTGDEEDAARAKVARMNLSTSAGDSGGRSGDEPPA